MTAARAWHPPWPGFEAGASLVLPLPTEEFAALDADLQTDGLVLTRKREFHVTLLDRALGARLHTPAPGGTLALRVPALFAGLDWQWRRSGERWLLRETREGADVHTVSEMLDMPALEAFRQAIARWLDEPVAPTPAHVTLYLSGTRFGIGLSSLAEFKRLRLHPL